MYRTIAIIVLGCAAGFGQTGGAASTTTLTTGKLCFVDGMQYQSVQDAVSDCGGSGVVVIPPTYSGSDSGQDVSGGHVLDFRRPATVKGLTPVTQFGTKGDAVTGNDGVSESGSATFTAASGHFESRRDEGKAIVITGAGPENASLTTTIKAVNGPNRVTLATAAGFTGTNLTYWYGTDNTGAMQSAYHSGKLLLLPPGEYLMTGTVKGQNPLFLVGSGEGSVLIDDVTVFDVHGNNGHYLDNVRMEAATKLTAVPPRGFPTRYAGTPVALDRVGAGVGYQPQVEDEDIWRRVSPAQQKQDIGPQIKISSDRTHIYRITGDLVSILAFDTQYSEIALCNFRGGKNWSGGLVLWHTPDDGKRNSHDRIHDNTVRYASFNGIVWVAADNVSIVHNHTEYNGESGFKNRSNQRDGTYDSHIQIIGNSTQHNHYDGFDLSESYPHTNTFRASSTASGNTSSFNDRTGTFVDGKEWTLTNNTFENNGLSGMSMDVSDSVISGNTLQNNNTLHDARSHQMLLSPGVASMNNVIARNRIAGSGTEGAAIRWSRDSTGNKVSENTATGGAVFRFEAPPGSSRGNSDSRGRYPDR